MRAFAHAPTASAAAPAAPLTGTRRSGWRRAGRALAGMDLVLGLGAAALLAVLWLSLRPQAGEWAETVHVRVPGLAQPVQLSVGVPSLIRLATQPAVAQALASRTWQWGRNTVVLRWSPNDKRLQASCTPCWVQHPALASQAVQLTGLLISVQRHGEALHGDWRLGQAPQALAGSWQGNLSQQHLALKLSLPASPIAHAYRALAPALPEVARARIAGHFSLQASVRLPDGRWHLQPELHAMRVSGLGTEALQQLPRSGLPPQHALARAVLAAEDQRFAEHQGFDPNQWQQVLAQAHLGSAQLRGASTLTQQLAKLMFTDGERSALRKLRELLYAVEMEETLGKARILQLYLAHAPWGEGVVGAEAAAQHYFARPAARLTVAQAVWLAAMLNAPDRHASRWQAMGHVDLPRAHWVAQQLRTVNGVGLRPAALARVQHELAALSPHAAQLQGSTQARPPSDALSLARAGQLADAFGPQYLALPAYFQAVGHRYITGSMRR